MISSSTSRSLALLLALLPQLLLVGLGRGIVLCSADDGHLQVEVLASGCCEEAAPVRTASETPGADAQGEADCGPCSDFELVPDLRSPRTEGDHLAPALAALPVPTAPAAAPSTHLAAVALARDLVPPHLSHLRSVSLRC